MCACVPTHCRFAFKYKIKYDYAAQLQKEHWRYGTSLQTSSRKKETASLDNICISKWNKILHLKSSAHATDVLHSK